MHHDREATERRSPFDVRDEVVGDLDALGRRSEDEIARVEDELVALGDGRLRDILADLVGLGRMDTRDVGALELQETLAEPQVDARGLDLLIDVGQRFDDEVPVREPVEDVGVRQDHTETTGSGRLKNSQIVGRARVRFVSFAAALPALRIRINIFTTTRHKPRRMSTDDVSRRTFMRTAGGATAAAGAATATAGTAAAQEEEPDWPSEADGGNLGTYEDARGEDEVTVMVGADDDGLAFDATLLWVDPETTITWEWTGAGGAHNVATVEGEADLDSGDPVDTEGHTYEYEVTEEDAGITSYVCEPHDGVNMFGGLAVGDDGPTVDPGGGGGGGVFVPQGARALGIATFIAMVSTLGLAFVFMKYGGTITKEE